MIFIRRWPETIAVLTMAGLLLHGLLRWKMPALADYPLWTVLALGGLPVTGQVLLNLRKGEAGADVLAVIALGTSIALQEYLAAALIVLMLSGGQVLERFAVRKASSVLEALAKRMPAVAHRQHNQQMDDIPLSSVAPGDRLVVFPHETIPVDGIVHEGHGTVDESYLTGEPYQVAKAPGAAVLSGAINGESMLVIDAEKPAADSRYASIMKVMQQAEQQRPAMRRLADKLGLWFTPIALLAAAAAWALSGEVTRFLSVLVIATPCPLLIAIPVTLVSAISLAARQGIIIRDPAILEVLPTCRTAIFDKTGTLTYGRPALSATLPAAGFREDALLQAAASLERYSRHPLASAILDAASSRKLFLPEATTVSEKPGEGLRGTVQGKEWQITSRHKLARQAPALLQQLPAAAAGLECVLLCDGQYAGLLQMRDAPRTESRSFIGHLAPAHRFEKIILLSGDRSSEVEYLAALLGIPETHAMKSPEEKVAIVRQETANAPTLFMGDGINDAPALACATAGLAFGQHNSVTSEAAGAVILENSLHKVDELLHISLAMRRIALQSAIGGMILSVGGMALAGFGLLSPVQGALAQEAIDILAIANALRLVWYRGESDIG